MSTVNSCCLGFGDNSKSFSPIGVTGPRALDETGGNSSIPHDVTTFGVPRRWDGEPYVGRICSSRRECQWLLEFVEAY